MSAAKIPHENNAVYTCVFRARELMYRCERLTTARLTQVSAARRGSVRTTKHLSKHQTPTPICARSVTGEAGENGQSSGAVGERQARIRPSVTSEVVGALYRVGRSLSTGSPAGRVAYCSETSRGRRARLDVLYSQAAVSRVLSL